VLRRLPLSRQRKPVELRHRPDHRGQRRKRHALSGNPSRRAHSPAIATCDSTFFKETPCRDSQAPGASSPPRPSWRCSPCRRQCGRRSSPSGAIGRPRSPSAPTSRTPSSASRRAPGVKVKITWYEKSALYASLKTALRAGQAPDVFYAEVDQTDYIDNNLLADLSTGINWANVEPWAKQAWTFGKGTYGFPLEASTVEVYYNTKLMNDLGVKVPASGQFDQAEFLDLVKKAKAKGITPMAQGVGDRPFPAATSPTRRC
jgi:hypothetical protein